MNWVVNPIAPTSGTIPFENHVMPVHLSMPRESFRCSITGIQDGEIQICALSLSGEEFIAFVESNHIPTTELFVGNIFRIDVLLHGRHRFGFIGGSVVMEKTRTQPIDITTFVSTQPELDAWMKEVMQGSKEFDVEQLQGLSRPAYRINFSSDNFDYTLLSCRGSDGYAGVLTGTAKPRLRREGEPLDGYDIAGGSYDVASWTRMLHKIACLETMRNVRVGRTANSR